MERKIMKVPVLMHLHFTTAPAMTHPWQSADTNGDDQSKDNASTAPVPATLHRQQILLPLPPTGPQPPVPRAAALAPTTVRTNEEFGK
jgi:hypothetical protein